MFPIQDEISIATGQRVLTKMATKIRNEEALLAVMELRPGNDLTSCFVEMLFCCECDDNTCTEMIAVSTHEYEQTHRSSRQSIVIPGHVKLDLGSIKEKFANYIIVEMFFPHSGVRAE